MANITFNINNPKSPEGEENEKLNIIIPNSAIISKFMIP